ncbi:hypothetical protein L218DRAFT_941668 [Marasmius fiardii PR-910]|nr:hypothetical protein L218DRAFT_941668 [Marasmius fiardii PR-910]
MFAGTSNQVGNSVNVEGQYNTAITNNYGNNYYQSVPQPNGAGLSDLKMWVAFNALYNSEARYPQPKVLPGTRKEILQRLSSWCELPFKENRVFWVSGAAGVGKSAIAQTLSEKYIQSGQLAAAFFFSRNDPTRDKLDPFVTTITHQLATSKVLKPLIAPFIDNIIGSMPETLYQTWETQFQTLIADTLAQVDPRSWSELPHLVIVDGVDECIQVGSQKRLLNILQSSTPTLPLDFLDSWPSNSVIAELLDRATGQFIYATTVIKYINYGKLPLTPMKWLDVILQAKRMANSSSPYPDLDLLYSQILQFCLNKDRKLQQILRLITGWFTSLSWLYQCMGP